MPDRPRALAEIRRVLRPGGALYAATNGRAHLRELTDLVIQFDPDATVPGSWLFSTRADGLPTGLPFSLDEGAAELAPYFASVELRRYPDSLVVTEAAPLVAYVRSTGAGALLRPERLPALEEFFAAAIARVGAVRITKDAGVFIATR